MLKLLSSIGFLLLVLTLNPHAVSATPEGSDPDLFLQVNDVTISQAEFRQIFASAVRYKYYHGQVPQAELDEFRKQVTDDLIAQVLVHGEALKLGLQADREKIDADVEAFEQRYAGSPDWAEHRERVVTELAARLERQDLLERMETRIRDIDPPSAAQVEQYYRDNPEKFTEPSRHWVSVILREVPPFSAEDAWAEATEELNALKKLIEAGEDFDTLAKDLSDHASAANGGDLGYVHQGVLETSVEEKVEALEIGQLSEPIRVLEGITLFRLNGVQPAALKSFDEVRERAAGLLHKEMRDQAWQSYLEGLRAMARIVVNE